MSERGVNIVLGQRWQVVAVLTAAAQGGCGEHGAVVPEAVVAGVVAAPEVAAAAAAHHGHGSHRHTHCPATTAVVLLLPKHGSARV